jgi:hypothetical protein
MQIQRQSEVEEKQAIKTQDKEHAPTSRPANLSHHCSTTLAFPFFSFLFIHLTRIFPVRIRSRYRSAAALQGAARSVVQSSASLSSPSSF